MKKNFTLLSAVLLACLPFSSFSQDTLIYEDFTNYDGTSGTVPSGWDFSSNGSYTSSFVTSNSGQPAYQFNSSTDRITCPTFSGADSVEFWLKGASTDSLSSLTVLESSDSSIWDTLAFIVPLPTSSTYKKYFVKATSKHLKFEYEKSAGNLAFDDFLLTGPEAITANFSAPGGCLGDSTCFQDLSSTFTGTITSWVWNFGDGNTDSVQNPCHIYSSAGSYTVQLTIINSSSDTDIVSKTINTGSLPVALFSPADTSGCSPLTVNFMDMSTISTGAISTYLWDFSNGAMSTATDTNIIFSNADTFNVSLIVTSDLGCTDTAFGTVMVFAIPVIDTIGITITPSNCGSNDGSITGISVSGNSPFTYMWTPAMQTTLDLTNVAGGSYSFTVTDSNSCSSSISLTLNSAGAPAAPAISDTTVVYCDGDTIDSLFATGTGGTITWYDDSALTSIVATGTSYLPDLNLGDNDFYVTETTTCEGLAAMVVITVNPATDATINPAGPFCSNDSAINLTAIESGGVWSGTGITNVSSGTFNPAVSGVGTFLITYIISGVCGNTDTTLIVVNGSADATINAAGPFCINDSPVNLTAANGGGTWGGNGITNVNTGTFNPFVAGSGTHSITYSINGICGDTDTVAIVVNSNPVADFGYINLNLSDSIQFQDSSAGTIVSWSWDFGDSTSSTQQNPLHNYNLFAPQYVYVTLVVTDINGCTDSFTDSVEIILISVRESSLIPFSFDISPNPSNGKFAIQISGNQQPLTSIKISNILGEEVYDSAVNSQLSAIIDLSNQPEGTYFVTITSGGEIAIKKIVVVK